MVNYLTTLSGSIGTAEEFSHTLAIISSDTATQVAEDMRDEWAISWQTGGPTLESAFSSQVEYDDAACAAILDPLTGEVAPAQHATFAAGGVDGTGSSQAYQVAAAISLTGGDRPNGTPIRGRFYLPCMGASAVVNGRIPSGTLTAVTAHIQRYFAAMAALGHQPSVWSRKEGTLTILTEARMGDVPDTIRSRRNNLAEAYAPIAVP